MVRVFLGPHLPKHCLLVLVEDGTEAVKRFNGADADQIGARFALAVPLCKHVPKSGVVHVFDKQVAKRVVLKIDDVIVCWHWANPAVTVSLAPALPVNLVRADGAGQGDRQTTPINVEDVAIGAKDAMHELLAVRVVGFVVHNLDTDFDVQIAGANVVNHEV